MRVDADIWMRPYLCRWCYNTFLLQVIRENLLINTILEILMNNVLIIDLRLQIASFFN